LYGHGQIQDECPAEHDHRHAVTPQVPPPWPDPLQVWRSA
jgi:hypothetical protein